MPERTIAIEEAFDIIKLVYAVTGWNPGAASSREQRNAWFASAVACVHYGHPDYNPKGGDPRWCVKDAGGGRPQSDDVIADRHTREYFDLMLSAGADSWSWNLGRHSDRLSPEQNIYPPSVHALPGGVTTPTPAPQPQPEPVPPPTVDVAGIAVALGNMHARLDAVVATQQSLVRAYQEIAATLAQGTGGGIPDAQMARLEAVIAEQAQAVLANVAAHIQQAVAGLDDKGCVLGRRR